MSFSVDAKRRETQLPTAPVERRSRASLGGPQPLLRFGAEGSQFSGLFGADAARAPAKGWPLGATELFTDDAFARMTKVPSGETYRLDRLPAETPVNIYRGPAISTVDGVAVEHPDALVLTIDGSEGVMAIFPLQEKDGAFVIPCFEIAPADQSGRFVHALVKEGILRASAADDLAVDLDAVPTRVTDADGDGLISRSDFTNVRPATPRELVDDVFQKASTADFVGFGEQHDENRLIAAAAAELTTRLVESGRPVVAAFEIPVARFGPLLDRLNEGALTGKDFEIAFLKTMKACFVDQKRLEQPDVADPKVDTLAIVERFRPLARDILEQHERGAVVAGIDRDRFLEPKVHNRDEFMAKKAEALHDAHPGATILLRAGALHVAERGKRTKLDADLQADPARPMAARLDKKNFDVVRVFVLPPDDYTLKFPASGNVYNGRDW